MVVVVVDEDAVAVDDHCTAGCDSHGQGPQPQRSNHDAAFANRHELAGNDDAEAALVDAHNGVAWRERDDGSDAAAVAGVAGVDAEVDFGDPAFAVQQWRVEERVSFSEPAYPRRTCSVATCPSPMGC